MQAARPQKRGYMGKLDRFYPPGYEWREELYSVGILWALAFFLSWTYLFQLHRMTGRLYYFQGGQRLLHPDAVAEPFVKVVSMSWTGFAAPLLFLALMVIWHYFSYWRGTKSIYLMRRLPRRGVVFASCVKGPAVCAVAVVLAAAALYVLYLGLYFLAVPRECMPRLL